MRVAGKPKYTSLLSTKMSDFFDKQTFKTLDFTQKGFTKGEYDQCSFTDCNFENLHVSHSSFLECEFINCNLTNVQLGGTTLNDVLFDGCKLLGANFSVCNPFMLRLRFRKSILNLTNFTALPLQNTSFSACSIKEADFTSANLSGVYFNNCLLSKARFEQTNLTKANFCTAKDFSINPTINTLKGAHFSKAHLEGLLSHLKIKIT